MATTQLWPYGGPGSPYGSFAGKEESTGTKAYTATFTRLWPHGGPGAPYGSFAGKAAQAPAGAEVGPMLSRRALALLLRRRREWLQFHGRLLEPDIDGGADDDEEDDEAPLVAVAAASAPAPAQPPVIAAPPAPKYSLEVLRREDELWIEHA